MVINVCFTRFILDHLAPDPFFTGARTVTKLKSGQIIAATKRDPHENHYHKITSFTFRQTEYRNSII
jgi:hypothetical protein